MKITKERLRQVIKEELQKVLKEQDEPERRGWRTSAVEKNIRNSADPRARARLNISQEYRKGSDETFKALQELHDAILTLEAPPIIPGRSRDNERQRVESAIAKLEALKKEEGFEDKFNEFAKLYDQDPTFEKLKNILNIKNTPPFS